MYAAAIIVFREVLEAALVVSIVLAASRGIKRRGAAIVVGAIAGLGGAALVAMFAEAIAASAEGIAQELFNAVVLGILIAVALLREGSEVVLFLYGVAAGGSNGATMLSGGLSGLVVGILFGTSIYFGLLRIPTRYLFKATGWMILLLAAGMASQAARYLMQAGVLPDQMPVWNSSSILPPDSVPGQFLHAFAGYEATPAPLQLAVYVATIVLIGMGMRSAGRLTR